MLSIERVRKDAKALRAAWAEGDPKALKRVKPYFAPDDAPTLSRAQMVVARENLFTSWAELVRAGGRDANDLITAAREGDTMRTRDLLKVMPPYPNTLVSICFNPVRADEDAVAALLVEQGGVLEPSRPA